MALEAELFIAVWFLVGYLGVNLVLGLLELLSHVQVDRVRVANVGNNRCSTFNTGPLSNKAASTVGRGSLG